MQEIPLVGGNLNSVVRIGDTVRRSTGAWSATVHDLLRHLEAQSFAGAPRFLGVDENGREILSFVSGETGFLPFIYEENVLVGAARLLRRFHDATAHHVAPDAAHWQMNPFDKSRHEVICHNDFAPYNLVFRDNQPQALIDFDLCGPGPRAWDIAFALYWFVPLSFSGDLQARSLADVEASSRRLHLFCEAYGTEPDQELLDTIEARLAFLCNWLSRHADAGDAAYQKMVKEGHLARYQREIAAFQQQRFRIERNVMLAKGEKIYP